MRFIRQDLLDSDGFKQIRAMDIAFIGNADLDDRSKCSVESSQAIGRKSYRVQYFPTEKVLEVGGKRYVASDNALADLARDYPAGSIVIDATTLDFAEIALLLYAYNSCYKPPQVGFVYMEPEEYVRRTAEESSVNGAAFDLSSGFSREQIPPFSCMFSGNDKAHLVAFLGFEGGRLTRELNDDNGHFFKEVTIVFGIPPFQATWDLEAFMANSRLLQTADAAVKFCGANNPKGAYEILSMAHAALQGTECNRLAVAPFGTKPMAIGAALYCATHRLLRVAFDHPVRKNGRTRGVHCAHWYEVELR